MTSEELTSLLDLYAREKAAADATGVVNGHWIAIEAVADAVRQADVAVVERLLRAAEKSADEADWSGSVMADAAAIDALKACLATLKDGAR